MKVLILGATGRTGKHLVEEALNAGHLVNMLVRDKNKVEIHNPRLTVFEGNITDSDLLAKAMKDCTYLVSTLNISRTSDFPWARLRTPTNFLSTTLKSVLNIADEAILKHLVIVTAWGVHETFKDIPFWFRWLIKYSNIGIAYADHEVQETLIKNSTLNYTVVRPVGLTNSKNVCNIKISYDNVPTPSLTISRKNLAHFMISILGKEEYFYKFPTVSKL